MLNFKKFYYILNIEKYLLEKGAYMIQFFLYILIFAFIFGLHNKVKQLQEEVGRLKRQKENSIEEEQILEQTISVIEEKPIVTLNSIEREEIVGREESIDTGVIDESQQSIEIPSTSIEFLESLPKLIKSYFTEGNILVRIGGVILFFGLAFLVKYAEEHNIIGIEVRLMGIALIALVLLILGWRLRLREGSYGLILQGLGVALLYLVVFAAAKLYALLALEMAFIIMFVIVILGSLLAVMQNSLPLALFAITGGFLAPILTSDGGSHITLFSYYALLDAGIVGIAWYRSWRVLNLTGFFFTFVIATAWGILRYDPSLLESTEPFLILFFLFYLASSILFTLKQPFRPRGFIDATLVFGLPLVAFALQVSLVEEIEYAVAYSAVIVGTLYFILSRILFSFEKMRLLAEAFLALGVVFYTMAVPYALDDQLTGALWVLEGAAIIWISLRQQRAYARLFGEFLQLIALLIFIFSSFIEKTDTAFFHVIFLEYVIVILALFLSAYLLWKDQEQLDDFDGESPKLFLVIALITWLIAGWIETDKLLLPQGNSMLIYIAIGATLFAFVASRLRWHTLITLLQNYLVIGMVLLFSLVGHYELTHPFEGIGWLALLLFFAVHYVLLFLFDEQWTQSTTLHLIGLWLITLIGARELQYATSLLSDNNTWQHIGWVLIPLALSLVMLRVKEFLPAFFKQHQESYRLVGVGGLSLMIFLWEVFSFSLIGDPAPLSYIPLFNPLDIAQLLGLATMLYWVYRNGIWDSESQTLLFAVITFMVLALSSVIFARSVHFYQEVPYTLHALTESIFFQAGLSIIWSLLAMIIMLLAKRFTNRSLWLAGMGLLILVVGKLFFVELSSSGTVERIISFIAVGGLMLLIGYFAPLPPKKKES